MQGQGKGRGNRGAAGQKQAEINSMRLENGVARITPCSWCHMQLAFLTDARRRQSGCLQGDLRHLQQLLRPAACCKRHQPPGQNLEPVRLTGTLCCNTMAQVAVPLWDPHPRSLTTLR
jgi:hypothetical protein